MLLQGRTNRTSAQLLPCVKIAAAGVAFAFLSGEARITDCAHALWSQVSALTCLNITYLHQLMSPGSKAQNPQPVQAHSPRAFIQALPPLRGRLSHVVANNP
jgi:hypothetical protein